jgi:hypothetical protein
MLRRRRQAAAAAAGFGEGFLGAVRGMGVGSMLQGGDGVSFFQLPRGVGMRTCGSE